jgi:CheY-like chemotaxis protein
MCDLIYHTLVPRKYEVITCSEPKKAIGIAIEEEPCIVLLDYMMPGVDGITVLKQLRSEMPELKIVIITGAGSEQIAVDAMKAGADDYVTKPLVPQKIVEICDEYLAKFRSQFINLNGKYFYPLDDEVISRYEFLRAGYENPTVSINKLKRFFTFSRQDFYIFDKKKKEYGVLGLFDRTISELEDELGPDVDLSPKKRLSNFVEEDLQEFNRRKDCNIDSFVNREDPVQIRLEIIREAAAGDKPNVSDICKKYNLTREVFYQNYRRFQKHGVLGLLDKKKGRPMLSKTV